MVGLWTLLAKQFYVMQRGKVLSLDVDFDVVFNGFLHRACVRNACNPPQLVGMLCRISGKASMEFE